MDAEGWFTLLNRFAAVLWLLLVLFPRQRMVSRVVVPLGGSSILAVAYLFFLAQGFKDSSLDFTSLASVRALFQGDAALLAGWIHYLAFDLFVCSWVVRDSVANAIHHAVILPSLFLSFMVGPIGYLSYLLIRTLVYRKPLFIQ